MKLLFKAAWQNLKIRRLLLATVFAMLLLSVANMLEIFAIGFITNKGEHFKGGFLDRVMGQLDTILPLKRNVWVLAGFILFVSFFKAITLFIQRYLSKLAGIRLAEDVRLRFFKHLQNLPMKFYYDHHIGGLSSRVVGDASLIAEAVNGLIVNYVQTPFTAISALTVCFLTSWQLSLLIFVGFPLLLFPIIFLAKRVKRVAREIQRNQEQFSSVLVDFIGGIQTVKVFAMEGFSLKKYQEYNSRMAALEKKSAKYDLATRPVVHTVAMFFLVISLIWGLFVLEMQVPDVLLFCGMLYLFYEPIKKFAEENSRIQRGISASDRLQEVLEVPPEQTQEAGALDFTALDEKIEFKDVWFKYQSEWVLKGVSFTIKKGEMVALVGPTGAGKSTIAQLIPRLWDPQKGEILIDGQNLRVFKQNSLRDGIAVVPQKAFLFLDTVLENIRFGRDFSEDQVKEAARLAHAAEFIETLTEGYHTLLSEGGKNLSGGQQQRLTIARALVKKAPILIMDEATSSLDALSEHYVKETIHTLKGRTTQILIAHRLSTIENADKIFYLEHGTIIASGTKDELLESCAGFRQTWNLLHQKH